MPALLKSEAVERLACAVEGASSDDLVEIYAELFPATPIPETTGANGQALAQRLAAHVRTSLEPEEVVDLWNVVFPSDRNVSYDEEEGVLKYNEKELRYAEP